MSCVPHCRSIVSEVLVPLLCAPLPRVVGRAQATGPGTVEHAGEDARGVGSREDRAEMGAVLGAEERRPLDRRRVHDCADVVHPRLERRQVRLVDTIREAGAASVEDDNPRERPEPPQAAHERLDAPHVLDVRGEPRYVHQVERPVAEDLVGDVRAVRRLDVARLGRLHPLSVARPQRARINYRSAPPSRCLVRGNQARFWCLVAIPCVAIAIEAAATITEPRRHTTALQDIALAVADKTPHQTGSP